MFKTETFYRDNLFYRNGDDRLAICVRAVRENFGVEPDEIGFKIHRWPWFGRRRIRKTGLYGLNGQMCLPQLDKYVNRLRAGRPYWVSISQAVYYSPWLTLDRLGLYSHEDWSVGLTTLTRLFGWTDQPYKIRLKLHTHAVDTSGGWCCYTRAVNVLGHIPFGKYYVTREVR